MNLIGNPQKNVNKHIFSNDYGTYYKYAYYICSLIVIIIHMIDLSGLQDPFGDEIGPLVRRVVKLWQRLIQKTLEDTGLTLSQMGLLGAIARLSSENEETTQIALSQETDIDPMTTSTILRNLQKKGLVERKESETDTRARIVELTDAGVAVLIKACQNLSNLYADMDLSDIDKDEFIAKLSIIYDKLNKLNNQS